MFFFAHKRVYLRFINICTIKLFNTGTKMQLGNTGENMSDVIDYGKVVDEAMHIIVYKVLKNVEKEGLPGEHHFFISFATKSAGVKISKALVSKYPKEMTIVLQYQYLGLKVTKKGFSVTLSFSGVQETIYIPFNAITTFADPSVQFGLQFREVDYDYEEVDMGSSSFLDDDEDDFSVEIDLEDQLHEENDTSENDKKLKSSKSKKDSNNVVSLASFRKNK